MLEVALVTLGPPDQLTGGYLFHRRMAEQAASHDAHVRFVSAPQLPFPLPVLTGLRLLREARGASVVVVDSIATALVAPALRARRPSAPVVGSLHQAPGGVGHGRVRTRLQAALDHSFYRRATRLIVGSQALADELEAEGVPAASMQVVVPGRDLAPPSDEPVPDLRRGRKVAFLCAGNWVAHKGILDVLDAVACLPAPWATLHLVGRDDLDPAYAARVRSRLAAPDLAARVVVHGPVSRAQLALLYRGADAFVLASHHDAYGTVYGEAMASGLPVAGWRAGNLPNLADDGREGVVVTIGDTAGLAAGLRRLAEDDGWRAELAGNAARRSRSLPTWEQSATAYFDILREVAGSPR